MASTEPKKTAEKAEDEKASADLLSKIAESLKAGTIKNVVVLTGPEVSAAAGFPDLHSFDEAMCARLEKYKLPFPEALFNLEYFSKEPKPLYSLMREIVGKKLAPTGIHYFIRLLQDKHVLLRNYTQCVDTMQLEAGLKPELLVNAHGTIKGSHCVRCLDRCDDKVFAEHLAKGQPLLCPKCKSPFRPDIVFFDEELPKEFAEHVPELGKSCDLLIVLGCKEMVTPFASLAFMAKPTVPRIIIAEHEAPDVLYGENRPTDMYWVNGMEAGVRRLVEAFGWGKEYADLLGKTGEKGEEQKKA